MKVINALNKILTLRLWDTKILFLDGHSKLIRAGFIRQVGDLLTFSVYTLT